MELTSRESSKQLVQLILSKFISELRLKIGFLRWDCLSLHLPIPNTKCRETRSICDLKQVSKPQPIGYMYYLYLPTFNLEKKTTKFSGTSTVRPMDFSISYGSFETAKNPVEQDGPFSSRRVFWVKSLILYFARFFRGKAAVGFPKRYSKECGH